MSTYNSISTRDVSPFETGAPEVVVTPTDKPSFVAVGYMVLLGDTVRGIFFPTLWPLVSSFGGTRAAQGVIVAAFSMGRARRPSGPGVATAFETTPPAYANAAKIHRNRLSPDEVETQVLVSPSYGRYSTNHGYRRVLVFAHCLIVVGALLYSRVWNLASLFCAQIVLGFGCGTLGVTRAQRPALSFLIASGERAAGERARGRGTSAAAAPPRRAAAAAEYPRRGRGAAATPRKDLHGPFSAGTGSSRRSCSRASTTWSTRTCARSSSTTARTTSSGPRTGTSRASSTRSGARSRPGEKTGSP